MSDIFIDSQNFVNSYDVAPDKLRAELGSYYGNNRVGQIIVTDQRTNKIEKNYEVYDLNVDDSFLIPLKKHRIYFNGAESEFRDQTQWREYVEANFKQNIVYYDHTYNAKDIDVINNFRNNYFSPKYEDLSKTYNTNLLLNYNLLNYKFNDTAKYIKDIASIRTEFDPVYYEVKSDSDVLRLISQYENRINNFTGSLSQMSERQRNIFMLSDQDNGISKTARIIGNDPIPVPPPFPYQYEKELSHIRRRVENLDIQSLMRSNKTDKFIHQAVKNNVAFQNVSFKTPEGPNIGVKTHNLINLILGGDLVNFKLDFNELFLLDEDELSYDSPADRFVNGVRAINFLSDIRQTLKTLNKSFADIYESKVCESQLIGYKIEKFTDNDATLPTQTYYLAKSDFKFIDTQLKYGRKYIYKTSALIAVVGSAYRYTNLHVSQGDNTMVNAQSNEVFENDVASVSKEYNAFVDIEIQPSFQLLEVPIDEHEAMFYDQPTMPPEVHFYNQKGRATLEVILRPNLNSNHDLTYVFNKLTPADDLEEERLNLSGDNFYNTVFTSDYFTGRYEIYRMDSPPENVLDFADNFLFEADMSAKLINAGTKVQFDQNNQIAHFEDDLIPNRKYYYLFRTLTYHGTPSNYTEIFEVELLQDSDETKINVSEYKIPQPKVHEYRRSSKRIMRISPNFEHLIFTGEELNVRDAISNQLGILEESKLFRNTNDGETFKIRITSKHTGKKMDINVRFKLKDKTIP